MKKTFTFLRSVVVLSVLTAFSGQAQSITVTNTNDSGEGSLRNAVLLAEAGNTIVFDADTNGDEIALSSEIVINKNLSITGNGSALTLLSGNGANRIFVISGAQVALTNLAFTDAEAAQNGGAIAILNSTVTIEASVFDGNEAQGADAGMGGGAIYAEGSTLTINNSEFTNNEATGTSGSGGAILAGAGTNVTVTESEFTDNTANRAGGAIEGFSGAGTTITLTNTTLAENSTGSNPGNGGALHLTGAVNAVITGCTVTGNTAAAEGGGLWNGSAIMTITSSAITGNTADGDGADQGGGGIYNLSGTVNISAETVISNNVASGTAGSGGGILNDAGGQLTLSNVTLNANTANRAGGGIEDNSGAGGMFMLTDVTLSNNITFTSPGNGGGLHITGPGSVEIVNGTVSGNQAGAEGGGLWNGTGTMTITGTQISDNTASGDGADQGGGGIYNLNGGSLVITDAVISGNHADGTAGSGGGILNDVGSQLTVTDTEISGNTANRAGGGIEDNSGTSTILLTDVDFTNNNAGTAPGNGGGLHITGGGSATIIRGTVSGNTAVQGGGLWNASGTLTLTDITVSGNTATGAAATDGGGGIYNNAGTLNVGGSTISGNTATGLFGRGGGIHIKAGTSTFVVSTISGNTAVANAGGIYNNGTLFLNADTVTLNSATGNGGGLYSENATATVKNTIIAGNLALLGGVDVHAENDAIVSAGYNIIGVGGDDFAETENDFEGSILSPVPANLEPLADNGGATFTHALSCPNIGADMGSPDDTFADQASMTVFNNRRDIGAYEAQEICSTAGTDDFAATSASRIYPNPAQGGFINLALSERHTGVATIAIYEIATGKLVQETKANNITMQIGTQNIATGTYVIKIVSDSATETHKVIVGR